jgi:hypothetical protein
MQRKELQRLLPFASLPIPARRHAMDVVTRHLHLGPGDHRVEVEEDPFHPVQDEA